MNDLQAIEEQRYAWIRAVNARDVEAYLEVLTEDIVWLPPGQSALHGRAAFAAWVEPFLESFNYEFDITDPAVRVAGDCAVERGTCHSKMTSLADGSAGEHSGSYIVLWRKDNDNAWRIERYIDET